MKVYFTMEKFQREIDDMEWTGDFFKAFSKTFQLNVPFSSYGCFQDSGFGFYTFDF